MAKKGSKEVTKCRKSPQMRKKTSFVRFVVIVLSFISLMSRIIYCTFATWLTFTTFDCHPCANSTHNNGSGPLFISHHSSALFNSVRGLNIQSKEADIKNRHKRSPIDTYQPSNQSIQISSEHEIIKKLFHNIRNKTDHSIDNNELEVVIDTIDEDIERNVNLLNNSINSNQSELNRSPHKRDLAFSVTQNDFDENANISENTIVHQLVNDNLVDNLVNGFDTLHSNLSSQEWIEEFQESVPEDSSNTMTITLDGNQTFISSNGTIQTDQSWSQNSLNDDQLINDTAYVRSIPDLNSRPMDVCSEDCGQFLSIELSDPSMRKWATIVITGVFYIYAFVMFSIFMGACLALVDVLVIATFIEGAKLFAGFILIIIDSFNGKGVEFNLIDIRFNVNNAGNGWTADFSYSEYLLDIIIFFVSAYLCIRVFRCFERKRPKKVSSIEELVDTRGTYRPNPSRSDLEPIFEHSSTH
ncbi:uncharacterized protein LOC128966103 [Oppia nitens]|uniref:uncharacterized protein LOC128966103 n=1 Tax=Oppia nitens TaxID=1686743 RepID=UPI0023DCD7EC|nr:uncharacterized protein LOC128966103 [Oppia nitens]